MVNRGRIRRLEELARQEGVVIQLRNGQTRVFTQWAVLGLFTLMMDEALGKEVPQDVPTDEEALRLRQALENATPESKRAFDEQCYEFNHLVDVLRRSREQIGTS